MIFSFNHKVTDTGKNLVVTISFSVTHFLWAQNSHIFVQHLTLLPIWHCGKSLLLDNSLETIFKQLHNGHYLKYIFLLLILMIELSLWDWLKILMYLLKIPNLAKNIKCTHVRILNLKLEQEIWKTKVCSLWLKIVTFKLNTLSVHTYY